MLQLIRTDLFGYDPHLEVWRWRRSQPPGVALIAASIERKALATNRLSSRYARHNSIHVAIKICLGEVQRLNGI